MLGSFGYVKIESMRFYHNYHHHKSEAFDSQQISDYAKTTKNRLISIVHEVYRIDQHNLCSNLAKFVYLGREIEAKDDA